jgi:hypothetical protein
MVPEECERAPASPDVSRMRAEHSALSRGHGAHHRALGMFVIAKAEAEAIRAIVGHEHELSAAIHLRRPSRDHRQRQGEGMRSDHRPLDAAACGGLSDDPVAPS